MVSSRPLSVALLLALGLALYLPGLRRLPVTDRDEARYAQASKQMVESGDYLNIRFLDTARNKKPAGIYWLQAAAVRLAGARQAVWPYRAVSVAGALAAVLLVFALARRLHPAAPLLPAAVLAAAPLTAVVAHAATTDAVLLAATAAVQLCLAQVYLQCGVRNAECGSETPPPATPCSALRTPHSAFRIPRSALRIPRSALRIPRSALRIPRSALLPALGFWTALGAGILIKGPLVPLVAGLTIVALCAHDRRGRWLLGLRPLWGVPLLLLIVLPWVVAIQRATHGAFLREALGHDFGAKLQGGQESHGAPPGAFLVVTALLFWPLVPLAWRGLGRAWRERRGDPAARFLLAWLVPAWIVFECVPTKLPHYVLPLYPALAFLAVRGAGGAQEPAGRGWRIASRIADGAWWMAAALWVAVPPLAAWLLGPAALPAAVVCSGVAAITAIWMRPRRSAALPRPGRTVAIAAGFAVLYFGLLFAAVLPRLDELWLSERAARLVAAQERAAGRPLHVISLGYEEPSLAFTLGTQTRLGGGATNAVAALASDPGAAVLVQDEPAPRGGSDPRSRLADLLRVPKKGQRRAEFRAAAAAAGVRVREAGAVEGLNYSKTWRVKVLLFVKDGGP
jgi:4-amino-4-deoxy-L-arabinose transferase-like glycosyltransferase